MSQPRTQPTLYIDAYNKHNIEETLKKTSEEVKWLYRVNAVLLIEIDDKNAMQITADAHLSQLTHALSQIRPFLTFGDSVVAIKEAFSKDRKHS